MVRKAEAMNMRSNAMKLRGPKIVRHNQHVFSRDLTQVRYFRLDTNARFFFVCRRCGLRAMADRLGQFWKNWSGEGSRISCGDQIAKQVHDL